jgi:hypothetical protein
MKDELRAFLSWLRVEGHLATRLINDEILSRYRNRRWCSSNENWLGATVTVDCECRVRGGEVGTVEALVIDKSEIYAEVRFSTEGDPGKVRLPVSYLRRPARAAGAHLA